MTVTGLALCLAVVSLNSEKVLPEMLWRGVREKLNMLDLYTQQRNPSYVAGHSGIASASGLYNYGERKTRFIFDQLLMAQEQGRLPDAPVSCESGFNAGHSAIVFLQAMPLRSSHYEFSFGGHPGWRKVAPYELQNAAFFRSVFGPRFNYIDGDTNVTLRNFAESAPEIKCDVVFVDGAKGTAARANDLNLFRAISKPGAMVFGDEIDTVSCASGQDNPTGCTTFGRTALAYHKAVRSGFLKYESCSHEARTRWDLVCLWSFLQ